MNSNRSSFKWIRMRFRRGLAASLVAFMVWPLLLPAVVFASGTGSIWTTDVSGTVVNENTHYAGKQDVYLNGGPNGGGPGLPPGDYYVQVTNPSGSTILGRSNPATITVGEDGRFPYNVQLWAFLYSAGSGFTSHGYDDSPNNGDEYKVWASLDRDFDDSKTDNFKVGTQPLPEPSPGISIDKSDAPTVTAGDDSTFTITVTNTGDTTLTDVGVTDTLEAGLTLDPDKTTPAPSVSGSTLTWTFASLAPGAVEVITLVVNTSLANTYHNTAEAIDSSEELSDSDSGTLIVNPRQQEPNPGISIDKSDAPAVTAGDDSTFTVTVTNTGDTTLTNVVATDTLPAGLTVDLGKTTPAPSVSGSTLTWTFATLAPGAVEVITLVVNTSLADTYLNTVEVGGGGVSDSDTGTLIVIPRQQEPEPDITIVKDDAPTVTAGDDSTFTITVTNTGDTTLTDVEVTDTLPAGLTVDLVKTTPTPSVSGSTLTWTFATLAPLASEVITLVVNTSAADEYLNTAEVVDDSEELSDSDTGDLIVIPPQQSLETSYTITKTDSSDPVIVGENTTYTITVNNISDTTLPAVSVYDTMPAGLEYVSAEPAPYITSPLGWHLPDLGPGANYVIKVRAKAVTVGTWTNSAHVHVGELPPVYAYEDTNVSSKPTTNETTPSVTPPLAPPVIAPATYDLSIKKVDDVDPAYVGDTVTYTMTIKNIGDQPLTGLAFKDTLPAGMVFKGSASGISNQSSAGVYTWSLAQLDPGKSRLFKISTTAGTVGRWKNTVSVTAKEIPTAKKADELTTVLVRLAQAPQTIQSDADPGTSGTLPFTGFPLTAWWLTTATMIAAGLWLEITTRRKKRLN